MQLFSHAQSNIIFYVILVWNQDSHKTTMILNYTFSILEAITKEGIGELNGLF